MGSEVALTTNGSGVIEQFGASTAIADQLTANFSDRGVKAAQLARIALTESPYMPVIDGVPYGIEVSNIYKGNGAEGECEEATDTVVLARNALKEFVEAEVPGSPKLRLGEFSTGYTVILKALIPERRTPGVQRSAFEEAFVLGVRDLGVSVANPEQAKQIIRNAPKKLVGLTLRDPSAETFSGDSQFVELLTADGHIVNIRASRASSRYAFSYDLVKSVGPEGGRGGRAPSSRIAHQIGSRVVDLRTRQTKR